MNLLSTITNARSLDKKAQIRQVNCFCLRSKFIQKAILLRGLFSMTNFGETIIVIQAMQDLFMSYKNFSSEAWNLHQHYKSSSQESRGLFWKTKVSQPQQQQNYFTTLFEHLFTVFSDNVLNDFWPHKRRTIILMNFEFWPNMVWDYILGEGKLSSNEAASSHMRSYIIDVGHLIPWLMLLTWILHYET